MGALDLYGTLKVGGCTLWLWGLSAIGCTLTLWGSLQFWLHSSQLVLSNGLVALKIIGTLTDFGCTLPNRYALCLWLHSSILVLSNGLVALCGYGDSAQLVALVSNRPLTLLGCTHVQWFSPVFWLHSAPMTFPCCWLHSSAVSQSDPLGQWVSRDSNPAHAAYKARRSNHLN